MADWVEQEKNGELDTKPPPSLEYSEDECKIVGQEIAETPTAMLWSLSLFEDGPCQYLDLCLFFAFFFVFCFCFVFVQWS